MSSVVLLFELSSTSRDIEPYSYVQYVGIVSLNTSAMA